MKEYYILKTLANNKGFSILGDSKVYGPMLFPNLYPNVGFKKYINEHRKELYDYLFYETLDKAKKALENLVYCLGEEFDTITDNYIENGNYCLSIEELETL